MSDQTVTVLRAKGVLDVERGEVLEGAQVVVEGNRITAVTDDATMALLALAHETAEDGLLELLADFGIAGIAVSRWQLMSAPRRIDLARPLRERLAPLRRR